MTDKIIEDGFGNEWFRCDFEDCDLHVVRPGKRLFDALKDCADASHRGTPTETSLEP